MTIYQISDILIGTSLSRITILWQIFSNGVSEIKQSHNELVMAQMLIIKAIYACNLPSAEDIMDAGDNLATQPPVIAIDSTQKKVEIEVVTPADEIFEFLKYCHDKTDMETYYLLLNEVEVKEFEAGRLALAGNINITIAAHIEKLLESWSGKSWKVQISKQDKIISLKEKMLDKARQAGDYQVIKNKFPDANISDIILK